MSGARGCLATVAVLVGFIAFWELFVIIEHPPRFILPAPSAISAMFVANFSLMFRHFLVTLQIAGLGFLAGSLAGLLIAVVMAAAPAIRSALYPIVIASQTTPKIAIAPLLIVWFGIGLAPKVLIVALLTFFPVLINSLAGIDGTDRGHLELLKSVNATRLQTYREVRLPAAIPYVFAGLKLALTISVIGAIVAEWVSSNAGLGYLLLFYNAGLRTTELFAVLLFLVLAASSAFGILLVLERLLSWEARISGSATTSTTASGEALL
jgi:NitT/TauT family transport system permease protein